MNNPVLKKVRTLEELNQVIDIRTQVFIKEQNIEVKDELEKDNYFFTHFLLFVGDKAIAIARIRLIDDYYIVGRVAVLKAYRHTKMGSALMLQLEAYMSNHKVVVHAQEQALKFYQNLGYKAVGEKYFEANIPHYTMEKQLWD